MPRGFVKELGERERNPLNQPSHSVSCRLLRPSYAQIVGYGTHWSEGRPALKGFLVLNFLGETQTYTANEAQGPSHWKPVCNSVLFLRNSIAS